jgi:hypothetical protein
MNSRTFEQPNSRTTKWEDGTRRPASALRVYGVACCWGIDHGWHGSYFAKASSVALRAMEDRM